MSNNIYITIQEASSLLGVTPATLRNWDKKGRLKAVRNPVNKYRMYRLSDVFALQNESSLFPVSTSQQELANNLEHTKPLTSSKLRRLVKALSRILRDFEGNSSLIERFDELTKVMYCKAHDEQRAKNSSETPAFSVGGKESDSDVAIRLREAFRSLVEQNPELFPERFSKLRLADATIRRIVEALAPVSISSSAEDLKGLAYEEVIRNTFDKGENQQFFTPRPVVEFMVQMLDSALVGTVCDPACGTGGFLIYANRYLKENERTQRVQLLGLEVDERLAWTAGINLDIHDVPRFSIKHISGAGALGKKLLEYFGKTDMIITNPPFGSDLSDKNALEDFELGQGRTSRRRGVLFIERCLDLLKPGGLLAIIIDDSVLNGSSNADTRRLILERSHPFTIIGLPETAFMPYASVKASILFLQKKGSRKQKMVRNRGTFFAQAEVVGRKPNGDQLFRLNETTGKIELDSDLPEILREWNTEWTGKYGLHSAITQRAFWAHIPTTEDDYFSKDGYRLDFAYHHPSRHEAIHALQSSPYPLKPLLDLCDLRNEAVVLSKEIQEEEIAYIGLANIEAHTGRCSPTVVNGSSLKSSVKRFVSGDILFSKLRPELRKVCLVPDEIDEGFASSECLVLVPKTDKRTGEPIMLAELLSLLIRSDLVHGQIIHLVTGIGRPRLSKAAILNVRLPVPPLKEQRRLIQLYRRSESASQALMIESEKALERSRQIMAEARRELVHDILSPQNGE